MPAPVAAAIAFALMGLLAPGFVVAQEHDSAPEVSTPWEMAGAEWTGGMSAAAIEATVTARDQRSWEILWQMVGKPAPGDLPEGRMAVAVFRAAEEAPPSTLQISEVVAGETALVIGYRSVPAEGQEPGNAAPGTGESVTAPYVVRLLPVTGLPVYYVGSVAPQESE